MTVYEVVTNLLIIAIIYISFLIARTSFKTYSCKRNWLDFLVGCIFIFWIGFYVFVMVAEPKNSAFIGQVLVRPANLITFMLLLVLVKFRAVRRTNNDCK